MSSKIESEVAEPSGSDTVSTEQVSANNISASKKKESARPRRKDRKDGKRPRAPFTNAEKALILNAHNAGMTPTEIAGVVHAAPSTIKNTLWKFKQSFKGLDKTEDFKLARSDLFTATEVVILESMNNPEKLADAKFGELAKGLSVVHTANRLERNLSTANSHSVTFTGNQEQIDAYRNRS